jgi:hypothetical protein
MKTKKTLLKELRKELRYFQQRTRIDINALKASRAKCKEIGAKMRGIQREEK